MGRGKAYTEFWWGNLRERDRLRDPGVDGKLILRWIFRKWNVGVRTGSSWLRIETGGQAFVNAKVERVGLRTSETVSRSAEEAIK
jgi:hypothetical protein